MKKQTAVEWLFAEYINPKNQTSMASLFLEALQMEKEKIKDAYKEGAGDIEVQYKDLGEIHSEQYYNETYGDK
jgi:hypothetical protein